MKVARSCGHPSGGPRREEPCHRELVADTRTASAENLFRQTQPAYMQRVVTFRRELVSQRFVVTFPLRRHVDPVAAAAFSRV